METLLNIFNHTLNYIFNLTFRLVNFLINYDYSGIIFALKVLAVPLSLFFIFGTVYSAMKTTKIWKAVRAFYSVSNLPKDKNKNLEEWQKIISRGNSMDENERKFAVIAADSLIDKILALAGYDGENLGERLKKIEPSDLDSLQDLWEAHKLRNRIAHETDFKLAKEDAILALSRYEKALRELEYI